MATFHAVITYRRDEGTVLSVLTPHGKEVERRRTRRPTTATTQIAWAQGVLDDLDLVSVSAWRSSSPFADEIVYETHVEHKGIEPTEPQRKRASCHGQL